MVRRAKDLELVDRNVIGGKLHAQRLRLLGGEMEFRIPAPVFRPDAKPVAQLRAPRLHLAMQRLGPLLARVLRSELGATTAKLDALEDGRQRIVILNGDRVELVVMAARAADGQAQDRSTQGLHHLVQPIGARLADGRGFLADRGGGHMRTCDEKTRRVSGAKLIARQLLADKPVVRQVFAESAHHIVAVDPRVLAVEVRLRAVGLGPPDDIEPMLSPAFPKMRRGEKLLDQRAISGVGIARIVDHETVGALGRGQQTRERDRDAADEGTWLGGLRVGQSLLGQLREEEGVDRAARRDRRDRRADHRLKRPMVGDRLNRGGFHLAGPDGAFGNPLLEE